MTPENSFAPNRAGDFCVSCAFGVGALALAVGTSLSYLDIRVGELFSVDALLSMGDFVGAFFPPETSPAFLRRTAWGALQTVAIACTGTLLAFLAAVALAIPAAGRLGNTYRRLVRFALNVLRSVPELVWAALMVLAAGLGPFAGTLALALHTAGVLGRLFAETIENAPTMPEQALLDSGAPPAVAFCYGTLPLVWPQFLAYGLYRLEMNVRMAAVLGFVGAGGLGQMLYFHLSIFQQAQAMTVLLAMLAVILTVDFISSRIRAGLIH